MSVLWWIITFFIGAIILTPIVAFLYLFWMLISIAPGDPMDYHLELVRTVIESDKREKKSLERKT